MRTSGSVLVVAGSDSSGGAGLTRDVQVLASFHTHARCAITAVTVQMDTELRAVYFVPAQRVREQILAALESGHVGAIKIGMLGNRDIVEAVIQSLPPREIIPIVLDPVLSSTSGGVLLDSAGEQLLREELLPRVSLITPNIPEAAALLREPVQSDETMLIAQARRMLAAGPHAVLLKGGHGVGETAVDILAAQGEDTVLIRSTRIPATRRGTGCTLASAIAAELARGTSLAAACRRAHDHVRNELQLDARS